MCVCGASSMHNMYSRAELTLRAACVLEPTTSQARSVTPIRMYAHSSAPAVARSPHAPALLRKKLLAHVVQLVPDVHASQLVGQDTQLPSTAAVLGGQSLTVQGTECAWQAIACVCAL